MNFLFLSFDDAKVRRLPEQTIKSWLLFEKSDGILTQIKRCVRTQ